MSQPIRLPLIPLTGAVSAAETVSDRYRSLLHAALKEGLSPVGFDTAGLRTAPMRLPAGLLTQLEGAAKVSGLDLKVAFASLCSQGQGVLERRRQSVESALVAQIGPRVDETQFKSAHQAQFYAGLRDGLETCKVVMAEGSTGIGKSRVMARVAIEQAKAGKAPVVVSGPTLAVLAHLHEEFVALGGSQDIRVSMVVGASEFVDDEALRLALERAAVEPDVLVDEGVRMWVANGAKPLDGSTAAARALGENASWLMDDLRSLCEAMNPDDFALLEDVDNAERSQSRANVAAMREGTAQSVGVVLCTHMMLAISQKTQWRGSVPAPRVLLIDEAHLFESTVAAANQVRFSTYSAAQAIRQLMEIHGDGSPAKKALSSVKSLATLIDGLVGRGESLQSWRDEGALAPDAQGRLVEMVKDCQARLSSDKLKQLPHREMFMGALRNLSRAIAGESRDAWVLERTSVRGYPALRTGPSSVAMQLRDIWNTADGGVGLVSATLYAINEDGEYRCDYLRVVLNLPLARVSTPIPVREKHLTQIPTLHTPSKMLAPQLVPPSDRNTADEGRWHEQLALIVQKVDTQALGGVLVLCTAYADVNGLAHLLKPVIGERLVVQRPGRRFHAFLTDYKQLHAKGLRPVMLGVGTAWTGVDLSDSAVEAAQDTLLTDLVITRLPISLNQSLSMQQRVSGMGLYPLINESLLTLKQGLGRLIRRNGVVDRHIWFLDGRVHPSFIWPGMQRLTAGARRMLRDYTKSLEIAE